MLISTLTDADERAWNRYVLNSDSGTFCHLAQWKSVIESAYGMRTHYLYAQDNNEITGVLPLAEVRSLLFGHTLISTPFCVYGGPCANSTTTIEALTQKAIELAREMKVNYLEFRQTRDFNQDWSGKEFYFSFKKTIASDPDENLQAVPRKQRAMIRKGMNNGLASEEDHEVDRFYRIYATSVRNLGTPVYPLKYFRVLKETFRDDCRILTVMKDDRPVSSVLSLYFRDTVMPYYGGGLPEARQLKAYDFMYWELLRRSCEEGLRTFDFGRSIEGTGSFSFKKNWGFEPQPLYYRQYMVKARHSPDFNPAGSRYQACIRLWKKLPLPLANFLGPYIARNLG